MIRALIAERTDPVLFDLSCDYVGDLSETVALMWPDDPSDRAKRGASLYRGRETLSTLGKAELPAQLARWLDGLDETGRWALLKLVTGGLRIGVSARLAKTAVAALGGKDAMNRTDLAWTQPPYLDLFAWLEGRAEKPLNRDPAPFRPAMLAHAIEDSDLAKLDAADFMAEWKWDGIRVQAVSGQRSTRANHRPALFSHGRRHLEKLSRPAGSLRLPAAIDGELLILREDRVQSFNVLQQRLNRKTVTTKLLADFPAHLRAYDLLSEGDEDLRGLPFSERRARLEKFIHTLDDPRVDLSPLVPFKSGPDLIAARADPASGGAGQEAEAVEGVMLKRRDALYMPGRPKGLWWKWKRDPMIVDAVLMYAQRGHGKRSSFYSDYTFGVWKNDGELVPVGKAYFGFTDDELVQIDRFVRRHTVDRFGPVREVAHEPDQGLVLEVAFEGYSGPHATNPASPCDSPASAGFAGTSRQEKPTGLRHWRKCWRRQKPGGCKMASHDNVPATSTEPDMSNDTVARIFGGSPLGGARPS